MPPGSQTLPLMPRDRDALGGQRMKKPGVATMADLDAFALGMPEATKEVSDHGRPSYLVHGKRFCLHRRPRRDAVDGKTGEPLDDVLMFRVADLDEKDLLVSDTRGVYFTTPHFDGYPAVLLRIRDLERIDCDQLRDLVAADLGKAFRPDRVLFVGALPKTRSAKIVRRAVRAAALGEDPGDLSSLEDPRVLEQFAPARG